MTTRHYNYERFAQHPKLLSCYSGWLGQKICYLTHAAVMDNRPNLWFAAAAEVDRLVVIVRFATMAGCFKLSRETRAVLGELVVHYADGGWWTSEDGRHERVPRDRERQEGDNSGDMLFRPRLLLEHDPEYLVATKLLKRLGAVLMQTAALMKSVDVCRMGVLLAGFCYRLTLRLDIWFINSVLNDLAAYGMTDRLAVSELRLALGLKDITAGHGEDDPSASYVGTMTGHQDLVLACVFRHFDVMVPPTESDALRYPELADLKTTFRTAPAETKRTRDKTELTEETRFWTEEAIAYLGLDRCGLARPELALQRFIKKGVLRPIKIGRRNAFTKAKLDRILSRGGQARRRGRPRKDGK